jgi:hypothetical protein
VVTGTYTDQHTIPLFLSTMPSPALDVIDERYLSTIVYGIQCMVTGEMYVGSTFTTLTKRIGTHLSGGKAGRKCSSWAILERGNYIPYVIQKRPCNTRKEMLKLEGNWQRAYKASFGDYLVNDRIEGIFWKDSPESKAAYYAQYY